MTQNNRDPKFWMKVGWSFVIAYLLAIIWILPNNTSLLTRRWGRYLTPVANQLGLNNAWQFFSPAPAPPMYLAYSVDRGGQMVADSESTASESLSETFYFPEHAAEGRWSPNYNRLIYAMRFMVLDAQRIESYFVPWVCRQHPGALSVSVQHIIKPVPQIETLDIGTSYRNWADALKAHPMDIPCPTSEESSL